MRGGFDLNRQALSDDEVHFHLAERSPMRELKSRTAIRQVSAQLECNKVFESETKQFAAFLNLAALCQRAHHPNIK